MVEQRPVKAMVPGSSPGRGARCLIDKAFTNGSRFARLASTNPRVEAGVLAAEQTKTTFCGKIIIMEKKINRFVYWAPRILSIAFVLFLMVFSLDVFEPGLSAQEIAIGLFMHNIPALILAAVVVISWKREIVGGIVFILAGVAYIALTATAGRLGDGGWVAIPVIAGPAFLIGILYILNWVKKERI